MEDTCNRRTLPMTTQATRNIKTAALALDNDLELFHLADERHYRQEQVNVIDLSTKFHELTAPPGKKLAEQGFHPYEHLRVDTAATILSGEHKVIDSRNLL